MTSRGEVFELFFTLSPDPMCVASIDGYFKRVNPAFGLLGYSLDELLKRPFLEFVHPADVANTVAEIDKLAAGGVTLHFDNRYRCKDGTYRWLSWNAASDATGCLYAIARDVTEAKNNETQLARAKDQAEMAQRELESFSYSVAHDLRAPLRGIDGFSAALQEEYSTVLDEGGRNYLRLVRESAQHMGQLIDDLLRLSHVTRAGLNCVRVDLSALAREVVGRLHKENSERRVDVTIPEGVVGRGDPRLLGLALENLLRNAWKFTGRAHDAHIEFGVQAAGQERVYFVRDNGAGFDMRYAQRLFGVFQRLHGTDDFEGTGVGLATVQRVIQRHKGRVWAEGAVNRGATFYFTLPEDA